MGKDNKSIFKLHQYISFFVLYNHQTLH